MSMERKYKIEIIQPVEFGDMTWYQICTHISTSPKKAIEEIKKLNPDLKYFDIRATRQ